MPWRLLPREAYEQYNSSWVTLPNTYYDPEIGHQDYNSYLDEMEYAEAVGLDGVCVNEHHQNAYGTMPSPNIMAAALARRTKRCQIAILGNALPLRQDPQRVAEEVAMLDVITGGRIISGFVRGIGAEYHSFAMNPTHSRERFWEAHDLIIQAWTQPGPTRFEGKYYRYRYLNIWPRPLQKPHPPIWIPSQGSMETIEEAAKRDYTYCQTFAARSHVARVFKAYREAYEKYHGRPAPAERMAWAPVIYVAESDQQAREEAEPHLDYLFNTLLKMPTEFYFPPGYTSERGLEAALTAKSSQIGKVMSFDELVQEGYAIVGSPQTALDQLYSLVQDFGFGRIIGVFQFGSLPHRLTIKNLELFARHVLPTLRVNSPVESFRARG